MENISPQIERVARALCKADGKDPDQPYTFKTCGGTMTMSNWQHHYPFAAAQAIKAMWQDANERSEEIDEDIWDDAYDWADTFSDVFGCNEPVRARLTRAFATAMQAERDKDSVEP